jgi:hypothetical protein
MASILITISTPQPNEEVGDNISVQGEVSLQLQPGEGGGNLLGPIVSVRFGTASPIAAQLILDTPQHFGWHCSATIPRNSVPGDTLAITVRCDAGYVPDEDPSGFIVLSDTRTVVVSLRPTPPQLTIAPFEREVVTSPSVRFPLFVHGTAFDASGVASVQYKLDTAPFANVDNLTGDWARWEKTIPLDEGERRLIIKAVDTRGATASEDFTISVRTPFEPTPVEQAFAPTTYLRELLAFATRQIKIGEGPGPTPLVLAGRFFQPFDGLTTSSLFEQAVMPVHQSRIAIEVLRRRISTATPTEIDRRFRSAAYQALLRELGTSHEELRLARVADAKTRLALAARLGIEVPDRLDQITFLPDEITDAQLEQLFGYRSTAPDDPLQPPGAGATLLTWQLDALRNAWKRDDVQTRDTIDGSLPIIDPDLISSGNIKVREATSSAFSLWTARKSLIAATLSDIEREGQNQTNLLVRFDQIILKFVGSINLAALAARDLNGEEITGVLRGFNLDLEGFRFLARARELLAAGTLLQSEWQDIYAIILQRQKQSFYLTWRDEEVRAGLILEPSQFLPDAEGPAFEIPRWRGSLQTFARWRRTLVARVAQRQTVENSYMAAVDAAEAQTLPGLRDALIEVIGQRQQTPEDLKAAAERLTRELLIDFRANAGPKTTRVDQALETLQGILFSVRSGRLATGTEPGWTLEEQNFDAEWEWMGSYRSWVAAMRVFAYPESQLFPNLYMKNVRENPPLEPTRPFEDLIKSLRGTFRVTPQIARQKADEYLDQLRRANLPVPLPPKLLDPAFKLKDEMSDAELIGRQRFVAELFGNITDPNSIPQALREVFWLVPMALGLRLQDERHYLAALDWFQTVYAFNLPPANRKIYHGLSLEESITTAYVRVPELFVTQLNPHIIARTSRATGGELVGRKNVYTRFTVMSIVRCFLDHADMEFSRNLPESTARARTLYETANDLLGLPDVRPETVQTHFPANPVWDSLRLQAQSNLAKIHNGLNIAGIRSEAPPNGSAVSFLPSQYRYSVLVERAKNFVGIAQQVEASFLGALEQRDAATYSLLQANHDIQVARSSITLADLKLADADIDQRVAELQFERAQVQFDHFDRLIQKGLNNWEIATLAAMASAVALRGAAAVGTLFATPDPRDLFGVIARSSSLAELASTTAQATQTKASFERRKEEWQLQRHLSDKDRQIGQQQIRLAQNQQQVAIQERQLTGLQLDHSQAVFDYLANRFTNAELFEWMSGILGRVYAYFLQQATAIARLAQAQLAFERQETAPGFVALDYWQDASDSNGSDAPADRRGLTGSARLLQDIFRLDQYAFDTDRRKLHLTQTLSLSQIAPFELQQFRETGLLVFATPTEMFDREFPGHYLRLIKSVRLSMIALTSPVRGIRASLSASGLSRVIVAGDEFLPVILSRSPETIAFTSTLNATGLFDLEPENDLLRPFEGMGVDAIWQLELPKAANPFDYRTIADVLLTIEYTALNSFDYRQEVLRSQDRLFSGDRAFSVRDDFPDSWYDLNNPETVVDPDSRMRAILSIGREDFPPHVEELAVQDLSLFCLRKDGFTPELRITGLSYTASGGATVNASEVRTTGGIIGTRRPNGAPWRVVVGKDPVAEWSIQLENTELVRGWVRDGLIQDLVLVVTVTGIAPPWL